MWRRLMKTRELTRSLRVLVRHSGTSTAWCVELLIGVCLIVITAHICWSYAYSWFMLIFRFICICALLLILSCVRLLHACCKTNMPSVVSVIVDWSHAFRTATDTVLSSSTVERPLSSFDPHYNNNNNNLWLHWLNDRTHLLYLS